jgi:hypothetical protein
MWEIPPRENGEFVANMEDILDLYQKPYDSEVPLVCMDEKPVQLLEDVREPIPARKGNPRRVDNEYKRNGTASVFMFTEPMGGWRHVSVRERRTAVDWAYEIRELLEEYYPEVKRVCLVIDNLNIHKIGSLYEAFPPEKARALARRLEIHYTPKHGSWLNIAEVEISALSRQCLKERIGDTETLRQETQAWERNRNEMQKGVDWRFTTSDARIRLKRLYPHVQH